MVVAMHEERGHLQGDQIINIAIDLVGKIVGNVTVVDGGKMYVRGSIIGNLTVEDGGRVHIFGHVTGELLVKKGAKVILDGVVNTATNRGGRLFIESTGQVIRKLRAIDGDTLIDPKAQVADRG